MHPHVTQHCPFGPEFLPTSQAWERLDLYYVVLGLFMGPQGHILSEALPAYSTCVRSNIRMLPFVGP